MTKKSLYIPVWYLFFPLALIVVIFSFYFTKSSIIQPRLVLLITFAYIGVSLIHHYFDKSLTLETILEYILIAVLVIIITLGTVI